MKDILIEGVINSLSKSTIWIIVAFSIPSKFVPLGELKKSIAKIRSDTFPTEAVIGADTDHG